MYIIYIYRWILFFICIYMYTYTCHNTCMYATVCICVCMYTYTYIYICVPSIGKGLLPVPGTAEASAEGSDPEWTPADREAEEPIQAKKGRATVKAAQMAKSRYYCMGSLFQGICKEGGL